MKEAQKREKELRMVGPDKHSQSVEKAQEGDNMATQSKRRSRKATKGEHEKRQTHVKIPLKRNRKRSAGNVGGGESSDSEMSYSGTGESQSESVDRVPASHAASAADEISEMDLSVSD